MLALDVVIGNVNDLRFQAEAAEGRQVIGSKLYIRITFCSQRISRFPFRNIFCMTLKICTQKEIFRFALGKELCVFENRMRLESADCGLNPDYLNHKIWI